MATRDEPARERVLIVDRRGSAQETLAFPLVRAGYSVSGALTSEDALHKARNERPHCILLDGSFLEQDPLYAALKADPALREIPLVLVLAGRGEKVPEGVRVEGLLRPPLGTEGCLAAIRAAMRSGPSTASLDRLELGPLVIDPARHRVFLEGEPVELSAIEFRLLHFLASQPGRAFSRELLIRGVCEGVGSERIVDAHVGAIRKQLGRHRGLIETVRGVGYRFSPGARPAKPENSAPT